MGRLGYMTGYVYSWHFCSGPCLFLPLLESMFAVLASLFELPFLYKVARKCSIQMTMTVYCTFHSPWDTSSKKDTLFL